MVTPRRCFDGCVTERLSAYPSSKVIQLVAAHAEAVAVTLGLPKIRLGLENTSLPAALMLSTVAMPSRMYIRLPKLWRVMHTGVLLLPALEDAHLALVV